MTAANAPAILDIAPDKASEYFVRVIDDPPAWYDNLPREEDEAVLVPTAAVVYAEREIEIMTTRDGRCVMVNAAYLAPALDAENGVGYTLRRRYNEDGAEIDPIVAVYDDMLACALVMPVARGMAESIWQELRKACDPGLKYALGGGGEGA